MATRTINISGTEQSPRKRTYVFTPRLASADGDVVLATEYKKTTNAAGDATIALPTRASGTITYDYKIPTEHGYSYGYFHLSAGSAIDLDDLLVAGGTPSDSVIDYVNERFDGLTGLDMTSPTDGQSLVISDDAIINVSETYRRLDTEFGVVADDSTNNAAAILTALESVRDAQGGTLVFPNGVTKINGSNLVDFNLKRGTLRLLGDGGNSRIHIAGGASVFTLQNIPLVIVEGLTFVGTPGDGVYDCTQNVLWFNAVENSVVRDCRFLGIAVNAPEDVTFELNKRHGIVIGRQTQLLVENCHFQGNGTANCANVGVDNWYGLTVRDSQFIDFGYQGAVTHSKTNFVDNHYWIRAINETLGPTQGVSRSKVMIERCSFDEGHVYGIYVKGCQWVELNNACLNTGVAQSIWLENVKRSTLNDVLVAKANNPGVISVAATDCEYVEFNNLLHGTGVTTLELLGTTALAKFRNSSTPSILTNTAGATVDMLVAVPATASSTGIKGQYAEDTTHRYYCTATNTWKRVAIATW